MPTIALKNLADQMRSENDLSKIKSIAIRTLAKKYGFKYWKKFHIYKNENAVLKLQYITAVPFLNQHIVPTEFITNPLPWTECIALQPLCSLKNQRKAHKIIKDHYPRKEGLTDFCIRNVGWYDNNPVIIDW